MLRATARIQVPLLTIAVLLASGCATTHPDSRSGTQGLEKPVVDDRSSPAARRHSLAERAALIAAGQVGVPYRYGGDSRGSGFDCSGLVHFAYERAGVQTPRTTAALWRQLTPIAPRDLDVGDVLFFDIKGSIGHVGLYLGDGRFVHAPASGRSVTIARLDDAFYRRAFVRGGRP